MGRFCTNCGTEISEDSNFCSNCGAPIIEQSEYMSGLTNSANNNNNNEQTYPHYPYYGVYKKWAYKLDLLKDGTIFKTVVVVFLISTGILALIMFFMTVGDGLLEALRLASFIFLAIGGGMIVLAAIVYYIVYIPIMGRYYGVIFEITDAEAKFITDKRATKKAKAIGFVTMAAGIASSNFAMMGQGIIASERMTMNTELENVTRAVFKPSKLRITLVESRVATNFIYVPEEEWEFMVKHITSRCKKAKIKFK